MTQDCKGCKPGTHTKYGAPERPFDVVVIGHGGWSGHHDCSTGHSSHYGHTFVNRLSSTTLVIDLTVMDDRDLIRFSVSGPMLGAHLAPGTTSRCPNADPLLLEHVAERLGLSLSSLDQVASDVYAYFAIQAGAAVVLGEDFECHRDPWNPGDTVCADCTRHLKTLAAA